MSTRAVSLHPWATRRAAVLMLAISEDQRRFIDPPTVAEFLADDDDHPTFESFAVCDGEVVVGLACYGREIGHEPGKWWVPLVVIDRRFQAMGYGRATMAAVVSAVRSRAPDCRSIGLSCKPDNQVAMHLYRSIGFVTGEANSRSGIDMWLEMDDVVAGPHED